VPRCRGLRAIKGRLSSDWMTEQLRTAASIMCKVDLLTAKLAGKTGQRT
jgi:hypothetical protein